MLFWIVTAVLTLAVLASLALALLRGHAAARPAAAYDLDVYRDQLREVERDVERGTVSEADAERVRTEVSRRILAADAALSAARDRPARRGGAAVAVLLVVAGLAGAYAIYLQLGAPGYGDLALADRIAQAERMRANRPSQQVAEDNLPPAPPLTDAPADYVELVERLRVAVADRPDDLQGAILLAQAEARLGNFSAAHAAKAQVIALRGADATATDYADYADLLVLAAGGYVSPRAEAALNRALSLDPGNGTARYYIGLMLNQTGRPDRALRVWDGLLREGPADAPWIPPIREQIAETALRAGVDYALPAPGDGRGPSQDQVTAAQDMTAAERMEMIEGMVAGLGERLATQGGPVEDWARLVNALGVLGRTDQALEILAEARTVFAGDPGAMDLLARAADRAGLQ